MRPRLTYLLPKDPARHRSGGMRLVHLMQSMIVDDFEIDTICLSDEPERVDPGIVRVPKPQLSKRRVVTRSLCTRRSLVHTRFDVPAMTAAIDRSDSPTFVTEHSYTAESFLASTRFGDARLLVSTDVSEALVWRSSYGRIGTLEAPRIERDELRVARAADAVGAYDAEEVTQYRSRGIDATWLDLTFPPGAPLAIAETGPRLVFLGERLWPPNAEAAELLIRWWPEIAAGIPGAELCIVGKPPAQPRTEPLPDGVRDLGFVDDLDALLRTCRALAAPIVTGGGVRVKILEALAVGLPVVSTTVGLGSLSTLFDVPVSDSREAFVERCRHLLRDRGAAAAEGAALAAENARRWNDRVPHDHLVGWLHGDRSTAPGVDRAAS